MTRKQAEEKARELRLSAQFLALKGEDAKAKELYDQANRMDDSFNPEFEQVGRVIKRNGVGIIHCTSWNTEAAEANAGMLLVYLRHGRLNADEILAKFPSMILDEAQWWSVIEPVLHVVKKECEVKS